jgi:hypothetical protein
LQAWRSWARATLVSRPPPEHRSANNKWARCARNEAIRQEKIEKKRKSKTSVALFQSPKRPIEYQGYRAATPDRAPSGTSMPIVIGAIIIAVAILLSTLITAVGTRFVGMESPTEDSVWLIDRLTGRVYKCQAPERGKASCETEIATGAIGERSKH